MEKLLLIIVTIVYIVTNIVYLVQKLKSFPEVQENSNIPPSLKAFLSKETFASLQKLTTNILPLSGFLSQIIISLVLLTYFISLLLKKKNVSINSVLKIFFLYISMKASPSTTCFYNFDVNDSSIEVNQVYISKEYILWILVLLPFLSVVPFVLTHSPINHIYTLARYFRSGLKYMTKIIAVVNVPKILITLSTVIGACAFYLLLLSCFLPWCSVKFRPNDDLRATIQTMKEFTLKTDSFINSSGTVMEILCKKISDDIAEEIKTTSTYLLFEMNRTEYNNTIRSKIDEIQRNVSGIKIIPLCKFTDAVDDSECAIYFSLYTSAIVMMQFPFFGGSAGSALLTASRVMHEGYTILKLFNKVRNKVTATRNLFARILNTVLSDPVYVWTLRFLPDIYMLLFIFPCLVVGFVCISLGFWKRLKPSEMKLTQVIFMISFVFFITNFAMFVYVWVFKTALETVLGTLPLITVEVEELTGWKAIKLAYMFSSASSLLLCINSLGKKIL